MPSESENQKEELEKRDIELVNIVGNLGLIIITSPRVMNN